jgi:protein phosphatase
MLCSDGVTGMIGDDQIAGLLAETADPHDAAGRIVAAALSAGGIDNATAVVVDVVGLVSDRTDDSLPAQESVPETPGALP